jgi:hypothetical protein
LSELVSATPSYWALTASAPRPGFQVLGDTSRRTSGRHADSQLKEPLAFPSQSINLVMIMQCNEDLRQVFFFFLQIHEQGQEQEQMPEYE